MPCSLSPSYAVLLSRCRQAQRDQSFGLRSVALPAGRENEAERTAKPAQRHMETAAGPAEADLPPPPLLGARSMLMARMIIDRRSGIGIKQRGLPPEERRAGRQQDETE